MYKKFLFLWFLLSLIPPSFAGTVTIQLQNNITENLGDSYVSSASPTTNYGTDNLEIADHSNKRRIYIRFNLSSLPVGAYILNSTLFMYVILAGATTNGSVYHQVNDTWDESILTWNNQPCPCNTTSESTNTSLNSIGWKSWTVTNMVSNSSKNGQKNVSIFIKSPETSQKVSTRILSREYTTDITLRPYLNITLNSVPTVPQISFPSNNSRHYNNSINFTWNQSTDVDGDSITYDFWLSSQSDFSNTINRTNFTNNWTGNIATTDNITYYGKMRSYDTYEYSNWSNVTQFTENNSAPTLGNSSISLSSIYPVSQYNLITVNDVTDIGDTITGVTVGITYLGTETNYTMTQTANISTWTYNFHSGVSGIYTVTSFSATDNNNATTTKTTSHRFEVLPQTAGGSSGGSPGGGGTVPTTTPLPTPARTPSPQINLPAVAQDPTGKFILEGLLVFGVTLTLFGLDKSAKIGTLLTGLFVIAAAAWSLGWF